MKKITRMDVEALKREMPILDEMMQRAVCGGTTEEFDYTQQQYESMLVSGTWQGGVVEDMGFVTAQVVCLPGKHNYYGSVADYVYSLRSPEDLEAIADIIIGKIPGIGTVYESIKDTLLDENLSAVSSCLNAGYTGAILVETELIGSTNLVITVRNANTGDIITQASGFLFS